MSWSRNPALQVRLASDAVSFSRAVALARDSVSAPSGLLLMLGAPSFHSFSRIYLTWCICCAGAPSLSLCPPLSLFPSLAPYLLGEYSAQALLLLSPPLLFLSFSYSY